MHITASAKTRRWAWRALTCAAFVSSVVPSANAAVLRDEGQGFELQVEGFRCARYSHGMDDLPACEVVPPSIDAAAKTIREMDRTLLLMATTNEDSEIRLMVESRPNPESCEKSDEYWQAERTGYEEARNRAVTDSGASSLRTRLFRVNGIQAFEMDSEYVDPQSNAPVRSHSYELVAANAIYRVSLSFDPARSAVADGLAERMIRSVKAKPAMLCGGTGDGVVLAVSAMGTAIVVGGGIAWRRRRKRAA